MTLESLEAAPCFPCSATWPACNEPRPQVWSCKATLTQVTEVAGDPARGQPRGLSRPETVFSRCRSLLHAASGVSHSPDLLLVPPPTSRRVQVCPSALRS